MKNEDLKWLKDRMKDEMTFMYEKGVKDGIEIGLKHTRPEPEIDVEAIKLDCIDIAQKNYSKEMIVIEVIDHLHAQNRLR